MSVAAADRAPLNERYGRLLSCSLPCSGISFAGFLAAAAGDTRIYWENQNDSIAFAGSGSAVELMAWGAGRYDRIATDARDLFGGAHLAGGGDPQAGPRLFGGFAFRSDFTPDNTWSIYSPAHFILPHYQLTRHQGRMWLTINTQIPQDEKPDMLVGDLQAALRQKIAQLQADECAAAACQQSELLRITYPLDFPQWERMITEATNRIRAGESEQSRFGARGRIAV